MRNREFQYCALVAKNAKLLIEERGDTKERL
jgi:hypothetical protein